MLCLLTSVCVGGGRGHLSTLTLVTLSYNDSADVYLSLWISPNSPCWQSALILRLREGEHIYVMTEPSSQALGELNLQKGSLSFMINTASLVFAVGITINKLLNIHECYFLYF